MINLTSVNTLEGEFIQLRKIALDDAHLIYKWRNSESGKYMNRPDGYSLEMQKKWISERPVNELNFIIVSKQQNSNVGMISIVGISEQDRNAEVGRLLLAPEFLRTSNPYGLEALKLCNNLILNTWGFNKVYGNVLADNLPMLRMQKYLGMIEEGLLRQQKSINGHFHDLYLVALFNTQFNKSYLPKINLLLRSFKTSN